MSTSRPTPDPGSPEPCIQRSWELALPTSEPALAPVTAGPWPHPPVQHQLWNPWALQPETTGPGSACQWAGTRPRTQLHTLMGRHQHLDTLGPDLAHQQVDTSPRTTIPPQPALSGPSQHTSRPAPAPGHPMLWDPLHADLPTGRSTPALGHLGSPSHQPWNPSPPTSGPIPTPR